MLPKILESEVKCGYCKNFMKHPRILDCGHSACYNCIKSNITRLISSSSTQSTNKLGSGHNKSNFNNSFTTFHRISTAKYSSTSTSHESNEQDALSESDSGIFLSNNNAHESNKTSRNFHITCINCNFTSTIPSQYNSSNSIDYFPDNIALKNLILRFQHQLDPISNPNYCQVNNKEDAQPRKDEETSKQYCQLCEDNTHPDLAEIYCEQCEVFYCNSCREKCHPMRGPYEKHSLIKPAEVQTRTLSKSHPKPQINNDQMNFEVKKAKVTLSKSLQRLSEKAKSASEFVSKLKTNIEDAKLKHKEFICQLDSELDELVNQVERKRAEMHWLANLELDKKETGIKEQINEGGQMITKTTAMINMAAELIKEAEPDHFITISNRLINRSVRLEKHFLYELNEMKPRVRNKFEFKMEIDSALSEINKLELKEFQCPEAPKFILDRCSVWDNLINVVWHPQGSIEVDRYLLEIDDGNGGPYKTAYCGPESMCTIENLHFSANYRLRIKSINAAGISMTGDVIKLTTSPVAKFRLLMPLQPRKLNISISKDGTELESLPSNTEEVVFLANTGFTRGVHYWEFLVEHFDNQCEPSFGVALDNCAKNKKLGTDMFSWGMYLNQKRSWFLHQSEHSARTDIHLIGGAVSYHVGVLLDMDQHRLTYLLDGQIHGPPFHQLINTTAPGVVTSRSHSQISSSHNSTASCSASESGSIGTTGASSNNSSTVTNISNTSIKHSVMLYPAVSISHGIKLRLITGVNPPLSLITDPYQPISNNSIHSNNNDSLDDITTPSLTRRLDLVGLLDDIGTTL